MSDTQQEPSMEEILASIRKIISEDGEEAAVDQAAEPEAAAESEPAPEPEPEPEPEEVAGPIFFLASKDAAMITGQYLIVDGGKSVCSA